MQPNLTDFVQARANKPRPKPEIKPAKPVLEVKPKPEPVAEPSADYKSMRQATYYMEPSQVKQLKLMAVHEERNISELVREAVAAYLNSKSKQS
jgi:hypothetical protein